MEAALRRSDFIVIGGGIAGIAAAAELSAHGAVTLLEAEASLGSQSTGRSAAISSTGFESDAVRELAALSRPLFEAPPADFSDDPLSHPLEVLWLARAGHEPRLKAMYAESQNAKDDITLLSAAEARTACPILSESAVIGALLERGALALDVHALQQAYAKKLRQNGAHIATNARVTRIQREKAEWQVVAGANDQYAAPVLINAAGAWCDRIAALAGVKPVGIRALRRSIFTIPGPDGLSTEARLPFVYDLEEKFYFKFEQRMILISPAEEVECAPEAAFTDEFDIAVAAELFQQITEVQIKSIKNSWAGTRNFAPDRAMVIGEDPQAQGFYWLAGQGGAGIMTAPGAAIMVRDLVTGASDSYKCAGQLSPSRFHR